MEQQQNDNANDLMNPDGDAGDALTAFSETAVRILRYMMLVVIVTILIGNAYAWYSGNDRVAWRNSLLCMVVVFFCQRELRRGHIERGAGIFFWGFWLFACVDGFLIAGIRTPILIAIPPLIMIVAWSQGRRPMLLMLGATVAVFMVYGLADYWHWLPEPIYCSTVSVFITCMSVIVNVSIIARLIAENFRRLAENAKRLTADLQHRLSELKVSDEALRNLNNMLEQRVVERTVQFDEANKTLQNLVAKLELAHTELVQSEKLASLGSMVAGISHELNTPVGNVLTLTTSLENLLQQMNDTLNASQVKRSEFEELLKTGAEMAALATKSTIRAVELMASFKQVAVDQTSEKRRNFNLRNVIEDNLAALLPTIKKQHKALRIDNQVSAQIQCDSYPGPLGQIIVNLTQNALLHGFDGRDSGVITITAERQGEQIVLTVSDDGVGMEPNVLMHVFDPFFTTKLGKGGSGIGLSISYRIASSVLGGSLSATSSAGQGAQFTLTMPMEAPFKL